MVFCWNDVVWYTRFNSGHIDTKYAIIGLTHWGRVRHICVGYLTIIGSENGLSPGRRQTIIWTNAGNLLFGPLGTNLSEIFIEIITFSFKKMRRLLNDGPVVSASMCCCALFIWYTPVAKHYGVRFVLNEMNRNNKKLSYLNARLAWIYSMQFLSEFMWFDS